jgi:hypothetical protein
MEAFLALLAVPAYGAAVAGVALLANRILADDGTGLSAVFRIELDPPRPRDVHEDEPVRWNLERLRRPARTDSAPSPAFPPEAAGGLEGACLP